MAGSFTLSDGEDASERYDGRMFEHRGSGEVKVRIKRVLPSRNDVGEVSAAVVPDFGQLVSFIRQHAWYGDDSEYGWTMVRRGKILAKGDLVLGRDNRVARMVEDGEWPMPHESLFTAAKPYPPRSPHGPPVSAAQRAGDVERARTFQPMHPQQPQQQEWPAYDPRFEQQQPLARDQRIEDDERDRAQRRRDERQREERDRDREDDRDRDRDARDDRRPAPSRRDEVAPLGPARKDPVVERLFDELSDTRSQMHEIIERSARDQAEMKAQFQVLVDRLAAPAVARAAPVDPAPAARSLLDDPSVQSLAGLGAAVTAFRSVGSTLGLVDGAQIAEMRRQHEAEMLKTQISTLTEKFNELVARPPAAPAPPAADAAAAAAAAAVATTATAVEADEEKEEREETAQERIAKRTTQHGPAVLVENEEGEIDIVKSLAASAPGVLALFKSMQEQKEQAATGQYELLRKANIEMERQTKLINDYAAAQERLIAAGGAMPDMPDDATKSSNDSAGYRPTAHVDSDESVTSLADEPLEADEPEALHSLRGPSLDGPSPSSRRRRPAAQPTIPYHPASFGSVCAGLC